MRKFMIILVDNNQTIREQIHSLASRQSEYEIIAVVSSSEELIQLQKNNIPDIILIDLNLAKANNFNIIKEYMWELPYIKLIAMGTEMDEAQLFSLVENGFKGFVSKDRLNEELHTAIRQAIHGIFFYNLINET